MTTKDRDEFTTFNVFLAKIRRESEGLDATTDRRRRQWCEMADAFVEKFGVDRTPDDIIKCRDSVRTVFGV